MFDTPPAQNCILIQFRHAIGGGHRVESARSSESSAHSHRTVELNFTGSNERSGEDNQNDRTNHASPAVFDALPLYVHIVEFKAPLVRQKLSEELPSN